MTFKQDTSDDARTPKPTEGDAALAIVRVRAWLSKAGFHEDPDRKDPTRVEVQCAGWKARTRQPYVDVRFFVPAIDVEHVVDGTHPDGITAEST